MRKDSLLALVCAAFSLWAAPARAEATRLTNPTTLYLEMGGRALGYGAGFDRVMSDNLSVGLSFGMTPTQDLNDNNANKSALVIPAYLNYYLEDDASTMFFTAGASLVASDVKGLEAKYSGIQFPDSIVLPTIGWGYESRGDMGAFMFRISAYAIVAHRVMPWAGFNFGYAF